MDAVSNIGFIASKILVLQKCLRIVQMGLDKSPEAPSDRLLSVVVGLLCVSFLGCFAFAIAARVTEYEQSTVIGQLIGNPNSSVTLRFPIALSGYFSSAAVMFALATLSSLLYVWHTTFHLSRYLKSLQKDTKERRLSEDEEPTDTAALSAFARIKNFASKMSPIQQTVKTLRGNLRRLQLSVALIALSFLCKAFLYVTLAVGYISRDPPYSSTITNPLYIDRHLCFPSYSNELRIVSRTVLASPLVVPLFTLFCDVFLTMYAAHSFPTHHHPNRLNQCTNQLKPHITAVYFDFIYAHSRSQPRLRRTEMRSQHVVQDFELPVVGLKKEAGQKYHNRHHHGGCCPMRPGLLCQYFFWRFREEYFFWRFREERC